MKKRILSILLCCVMLAGLMPTAVMAAETGYTYTKLVGTTGVSDNEGADKLVDGDIETKWCVDINAGYGKPYIFFKVNGNPIKITGYFITTGNDNESYPGRNPQSWALHGSNDYTSTSSSWEKIVEVNNDTILQDKNHEKYYFDAPATTAYQYFWLEIKTVESGSIMQMSEFALTTCDHQWETAWRNDETVHWHNCTVDGCSAKGEQGTHIYDNDDDSTCNVCGYTRKESIYTISFNANGGSVSPDSAKTGRYGMLTSLPMPSREHYTFDGWFTAEQGGIEITTGTVFHEDTTVYAHWTYTGGDGSASRTEAIQLGADGITGYANTNSYDYIYFGNWSEDLYITPGPVKWRVLDDRTNTGNRGLFLLSDKLLTGSIVFDDRSNAWQGSNAQAWCKDFAGEVGAKENVSDAFTSVERGAILATTKSDAEYTCVGIDYKSFRASENILNGDHVFFLSAEELENSIYGPLKKIQYERWSEWWLRSPSIDTKNLTNYVGVVRTDAPWVEDIWAPNNRPVRPAFNLDLDSVLFTSAATGGKSAEGMDSGLTSVGNVSDSEWKLTLKDSSRSSFTAELKSVKNNTVVVSYSGAVVGTNEYISAIVKNEDTVKYYGRISVVSATGDQVTITLPENFKMEAGDVFCVFNEQYNGDQQTDYASPLVELSLTGLHTHRWATEWSKDDTHHWHECTAADCDVTENSGKNGYEVHVYDDDADTTCNTCDYTRTITPPHIHCACGGDTDVGNHTSHTDVTYQPWDGTSAIDYGDDNTAYVSLTDNVTTEGNLVVDGTTLHLCLNGKTFASNGSSKIQVKNEGRLVLCDCAGGGTIKGATTGWGGAGVYLYNSTLDMYGGKITDGKITGNGGGGAIALDDVNCVFNMYGGEISGNSANRYGGAIFLNGTLQSEKGGTVNLYGGEISGNSAKIGGAIYAVYGGTVNLFDGEISGNTATANGGGAICLNHSGVLNMTGGKMQNNTAKTDGGAVNLYASTFTFSGGMISNNNANEYGGAIYLSISSKLNMTGGEISNNIAYVEGGAVHMYGENTTFNFSGGTITGNKSRDGGAVYLNQELSTLNMSGGEITGNIATSHGGAVYLFREKSTLNLSGGTIKNNTAGDSGGAVYFNTTSDGKIQGILNLSGNPVVKDNTVSEQANNIYMKSGKTLSIVEDMTDGASVGITTESTNYPIVFSNAYEKDYTGYFFADDANAHVNYNSEKKLELSVEVPPVGVTVSGAATSFNSDTDDVTIQLIDVGSSEVAYETVVQGNTAEYSIAGVASGTYTMKVMKKNHATREYTVTVDADNVTQDVKIHLLGDIDGDGVVKMSDIAKINAHIKETKLLEGYAFACADVDGNGQVKMTDITRVNAHVKEIAPLW